MSAAALDDLELRVKATLGDRLHTLWLTRCADREDWTARWSTSSGRLRKRYADTLPGLLRAVLAAEAGGAL